MLNHDHVALSLHMLDDPILDNNHLTQLLSPSEKSVKAWSKVVADQWNTAGISDTDGYPTITSHYGYHMTSWHVPLALIGLNASLASNSLSFKPKIVSPFTLPFYLSAGILGTLSANETSFTLKLTAGALTLKDLRVNNHAAPLPSSGWIFIDPSHPTTWARTS